MTVTPDASQAVAFFSTLFPQGGLLHFRAVPEPPDGRTPTNHHYQLDQNFPNVVTDFLAYCAADQRAAFFLPGIVKTGGTGKADVLALTSVLVDLDKGEPARSLAVIEASIGAPTIVVESGGNTADGHAKLHAYWLLDQPAKDADIATVCAIREALAVQFGGDPAFKQAGQVIRIPGSIHLKGEPKLVSTRLLAPTRRLSLSRLQAGIQPTAVLPADSWFDFSRDSSARSQTDRALTSPVHAEGKDGLTRFEAAGSALGHFVRMIRNGKMTEAEAWQAARDWNQATLVPPWPEERLRTDFERLRRIDIDSHGPLAPVAAALLATPANRWALTDWRADRFTGKPPERVWLAEGVLPAATPGIFAAVGDAGKTMMALQLGLYVATYPAPQNQVLGFNDAPRFMGGPVLARGAAVVLTSEDDADEIHRRLAALDPGEARKGKPLYVVPMVSAGGTRAIVTAGPTGPAPTEFWHALRAQLAAIPDLRFVVLDPISAFIGGDTNDNAVGTATMGLFGELAAATGATVMGIHHFSKSKTPTTLAEARDAIRGAGAFVDNGRWALTLWEESDDATRRGVLKALGQSERADAAGIVYRGGLAKGNAPGAKVIRTLIRNAGTGLLEDVTEALRRDRPKRDEVDDTVFRVLADAKRANPRFTLQRSRGTYKKHGVLDLFALASVAIPERALEEAIDRLCVRGQIVLTADRKAWEPVLA